MYYKKPNANPNSPYSPEISFDKIYDKLKVLLNKFTEKKKNAIQRQRQISADSDTPVVAETPKTEEKFPVNNENLINALADFEEKKQAIDKKYKSIIHGFTAFFFRDISLQKQSALGEILQTQMQVKEVITRSLFKDNTNASPPEEQIKEIKSALKQLHSRIDNNMNTLKQYRGLFSGKTTSDQLAYTLKAETSHLEKTLDSLTAMVKQR